MQIKHTTTIHLQKLMPKSQQFLLIHHPLLVHQFDATNDEITTMAICTVLTLPLKVPGGGVPQGLFPEPYDVILRKQRASSRS